MEKLISMLCRSLNGELFCRLILIFKLNVKFQVNIMDIKYGDPLNPLPNLESMGPIQPWTGMSALETEYAPMSVLSRSTTWSTRQGTQLRNAKLTPPARALASNVLPASYSVQWQPLKSRHSFTLISVILVGA